MCKWELRNVHTRQICESGNSLQGSQEIENLSSKKSCCLFIGITKEKVKTLYINIESTFAVFAIIEKFLILERRLGTKLSFYKKLRFCP